MGRVFARVVIFVAVLALGFTLFWRSMIDFTGNVSKPTQQTPEVQAAMARLAERNKKPAPPREERPQPSEADIAALAGADMRARTEAGERLLFAERTPALCEAVQTELTRAPLRYHATQLLCIRAFCPGAAVLDRAIDALPPADTRSDDIEDRKRRDCLLGAIAQRAEEAPERAVDPLVSYAMTDRFTYVDTALRGLERITVTELPSVIRAAIALVPPDDARHGEFDIPRQRAFRAAIALNAVEIDPDLFARALADADDRVRGPAWQHLKASPRPGAARFVARQLIDLPADRYRRLLANQPVGAPLDEVIRARVADHKDLAAALTDIALDDSVDQERRRRALEVLAVHADPDALTRLAALVASPDEDLRAYARAVIAERKPARRGGGVLDEDVVVQFNDAPSFMERLSWWWSAPDAERIDALPPDEPLRGAAEPTVLLPDGSAAVAVSDGTVRLGERVVPARGWVTAIPQLLVTPRGRVIALVQEPGPFGLYELNDARDRWLPIGGTRGVTDVAAGPDDRLYALGDGLGRFENGEWTWGSIPHAGELIAHPSSDLVVLVDEARTTVTPDAGQTMRRVRMPDLRICDTVLVGSRPDSLFVAECPTAKNPEPRWIRVQVPGME
jgi:hypothetical protein